MLELFLLQIALFSIFPLYFTVLDGPLRRVSYYIYIALVLLIGGFFGNVYSLPVTADITVSGGNICYGAFMMSSVLFVLVERDLFILRHLVRLVLFVDLFNALFSDLAARSLSHQGIMNPHNTSPALFDISTPFIILGGVLIILELLTLLYSFEKLKKCHFNPVVTAFCYILLFITVLCIDGILFPLLAFGFSQEIINIVFGSLDGKILTASAYALPLILFTLIRRKSFISYLSADDFRWTLLLKTSTQLAEEMSAQETYREQADTVFKHTDEGLAIVDNQGKVLRANQALCEELALPLTQLLVRTDSIFALFTYQQHALDLEILRKLPWRGEVSFGAEHHGLLSIAKVESESNKPVTFVLSLVNIDEQKAIQAKLNHLARHDQLTQLPNRRVLDDVIESLQGKAFGLLVVDLDHFKDVNDSYGHAAGDTVLCTLADRLRLLHDEFPDDVLGLSRTGGDEFAILIANLPLLKVTQLINAIQYRLAQVIPLNNQVEVYISATIGASFQAQGENRDLLQEADAGLYEAKRNRRGSYGLYEERLTLESQRKLTLSSKLKQTLQEGKVQVYYQPQYCAKTERLVGVEALARWHDDELGWVSPAEFIPIAEETGLIEPLGEFVLKRACEDGAKWIAQGLGELKMSVNVSAYQLRFGQFIATLNNVLKQTEFPVRFLELELTESAYIERENEVLPLLHQLKQLGVRLAIDDFGTGYSSLSYLSKMPWDTLKIDRSFIIGIPDDQEQCKLTATIIKMAHALNLDIVVEGVETREQLAFVAQRNSQLIQGYYYSPPLAAEALIARIRKEQSSQ
ncbi:putative bifunctional diguanylate cyclase/phosphodiesterase [Vibrio porteresiae]|uniref:EAL domain-containing protein n=1 Tax=Vibrio porteresiae DSM 19223 TaxID=1123496 RepID=A0ABZ0QJ04_9VIBR|nr:GGDEF domain-containing phosphodiesterase [Vibrio porteresiae]WPC76399.1 EAL domain-containing protein [Vibrio porteresiae DSM 19223]